VDKATFTSSRSTPDQAATDPAFVASRGMVRDADYGPRVRYARLGSSAEQIADSGASARSSELELRAIADDTVEARLLIDERTGTRAPASSSTIPAARSSAVDRSSP